MKTHKITVIFLTFCLSLCWVHCEEEYSDRYLYIAVAGDYGVPFAGSYGDHYGQQPVQSQTPDYYYFHLREVDNRFIAEFYKTVTTKKDFRRLTVRLYIKEFPKPASLLVELSQEHPESTIVVTYYE